jgi:hypothetical protein
MEFLKVRYENRVQVQQAQQELEDCYQGYSTFQTWYKHYEYLVYEANFVAGTTGWGQIMIKHLKKRIKPELRQYPSILECNNDYIKLFN